MIILIKDPKGTFIEKDSAALLATAKTGVDLPMKRGDLFRGAYICSSCGTYYLTKDGEWTFGTTDEENNWWDRKADADAHLWQLRNPKA